MKKILLIAYHYHPDLEVGAQRTIKYVKYLPQYGWQPHVLTVDESYYPQRDDTPLEFSCPVHRTSRWPLPDDIYKKLKEKFSREKTQQTESSGPPQVKNRPQEEQSVVIPAWKRFFNSLSLTPDRFAGWYFPAVSAAQRLIREHRYDAIYSSGPPQTCHMVGLTAHRLTGTPWVADFRDPWLHPKNLDKYLLKMSKNFDKKNEARTARHASLIITTTDEWRDHLKKRYYPLLEKKCHTIINGFDEDDFPADASERSRDDSAPVTFLYAGNLYSGRDPSTMLQAAGELVAEGQIGVDDIVFQFYGNNDIDMGRIDHIVLSHNIQSLVKFNPPVSRDGYLKLLQEADVLILIQAQQAKVHIPAKAFEYLGTGNEILTLTSEGSTRNFMSRFEHGAIAELENKEQIKQALKHLIGRVKTGTGSTNMLKKLQAITKKSLTGEFTQLLDEMVAKR